MMIAITTLLLLLIIISIVNADDDHRELITGNGDTNLAKRILISVLNGHSNIDIEAVVENDDITSSSNLRSSIRDTTTTTMLHLHKMKTPINSNTIFSFLDNSHEGQLSDFDNVGFDNDIFDPTFLDHTIMLAGDDNNNNIDGTGQTILQVDTLTGNIIGIQHTSNGKTNQITINNNLKLTREVEKAGEGEGGEKGEKGGPPLKITSMVSNVDRKFHCGADHNNDHQHEEEHTHDQHEEGVVTAPFLEDKGQQVISRPGYHEGDVTSLGKRKLGHHKHNEHHTQHSFDDGQQSHDIKEEASHEKKHGGRMEGTDHKVHFHTHENMHHDHVHHDHVKEEENHNTEEEKRHLEGLRGAYVHSSHSPHHHYSQHTAHSHHNERLLSTANHNNDEHTYQINMLIAIDSDFINTHGSRQSAINYINYLISTANLIYEKEFDTHLNIIKVEQIDIFQNANLIRPGPKKVSELRDGLSVMRKHYEGTVGTVRGTNGETVNLVHALIGQEMGGGIAFIDTICDSTYGVGFSSGLKGTLSTNTNMVVNDDAYRDSHMVIHEIGHSLGSGHSFDAYDPPVDACQVNGKGNIQCPAGVSDSTATLMSYCNFCDGGIDNIAMTFGGEYSGSGSKSDINSWTRSPKLSNPKSVSRDPQRISHHVWSTLDSKGVCIRRSVAPTPSPTTSSPTVEPSMSPTTSSPSSSPTSKAPSYFPELPQDDGRIWIQPDEHCIQEVVPEPITGSNDTNSAATIEPLPVTTTSNCATAPGFMFDMSVQQGPSYHGIHLESLQFEHLNFNATVEIYTIDGTYYNNTVNQTSGLDRSYRSKDLWRKVATVVVNEADSFTEAVLDEPITIPPGTRQGFYLTPSNTSDVSNFFLIGRDEEHSSSSSIDTNGVSIKEACVVFDTFGFEVHGFMPVIQAGYVEAEAPTSFPSLSPTPLPSRAPSVSPTPAPSSAPSPSPTSLDKGPFSIGTEGGETCGSSDDCTAVYGYMMDFTNEDPNGHSMKVNKVSVEHGSPKNGRTALVHCSRGSSKGKENNPLAWTKCGKAKIPRKSGVTEIKIQSMKVEPNETISIRVSSTESIMKVKKTKQQSHKTQDGKAKFTPGYAIKNTQTGATMSNVDPKASVSYMLMANNRS